MGIQQFQENEDGRKSLRFEGCGVFSLKGRKSLELCLVRLYREYDGFQGDEVMAGLLATARKEVNGGAGTSLFPMVKREHWGMLFSSRDTYCYKVMPFGLKNAKQPIQRLVKKIFKEQISKTMEVYVDDMLVKAPQRADHIKNLAEAFGLL
ncbi:hypothetical protein L3X38_025268 [Prunus dulcis]|uniref:Reverse transcriptase domain-containing protein n=1 Tax=Prunus dulcis TaxID=3755 RepID=A0AAD4W1F1_PRUDU|nr:hypothetical protein L3X38_025268 [Prunus dulcis]